MYNTSTILEKLQAKKNRGLALAASYSRLGDEEKALLVLNCGTYLGIAQTSEGAHIVEANFCKQRLCPSCAWRRAVKIYGATNEILDYIDAKYGNEIKYLFLTVTIKNVPLDKLGDAIDNMAAAYKRLTNNRAWKRRVKGAMRTLEITINREEMEFHPHYHLILAVDKNYATKNDDTYWTHEDWIHAWQLSARLDYKPSVRIQRVRGRKKGIAEVSKYLAKDTDYLIDGDEETTDTLVSSLTEQLKKRRLISYTGILRDAQRALRIKDPEQGELVDEMRGDLAAAITHYHWNAGLTRYTKGRAQK